MIWVETQRDERRELDEVRDRLMTRFPEIPQPDVASVVEEVYLALDGPIRDYIPVLVEHFARDRLTRLAAVS